MASDDFGAYARELASRKTAAIAENYGDHIVIGADTIVVHEGKHYPKPASPAQAKTFLQTLSGKTHTVITGVGVYIGGTLRVFSVETAVTFRELDDVLIDAYVESGDPMDKAGGYGIQTAGALLVDKIDGDYFNVMGLPIAKLTEHLRRFALITLRKVIALTLTIDLQPKMMIRDVHIADRPRERLMNQGASSLSNQELLRFCCGQVRRTNRC